MDRVEIGASHGDLETRPGTRIFYVTAVGIASQQIARRPQSCSAIPTHVLQVATHVCISLSRNLVYGFDAKAGLVVSWHTEKTTS